MLQTGLCLFLMMIFAAQAQANEIQCLKHTPDFKRPQQFGSLGDGTPWGASEHIVSLSIEKTYAWLLKHENWKDMSKTELTTKKVPRKGYDEFHSVEVELSPFPLISIDWTEEWGYRKTTAGYAIDYTKVAGTSHIEHLCGKVTLSSVSAEKTRVRFYEECKCTRMTPEGIMKSLSSHAEDMEKSAATRVLSSESAP